MFVWSRQKDVKKVKFQNLTIDGATIVIVKFLKTYVFQTLKFVDTYKFVSYTF